MHSCVPGTRDMEAQASIPAPRGSRWKGDGGCGLGGSCLDQEGQEVGRGQEGLLEGDGSRRVISSYPCGQGTQAGEQRVEGSLAREQKMGSAGEGERRTRFVKNASFRVCLDCTSACSVPV